MPELKYQEEVESFGFDMSEFLERNGRVAYRFVFQNIDDPRNFQPIYKLNAIRPRTSCTGWALSFFSSSEKAKARFADITKGKPLLYKKLGTHTAKGNLKSEDGVSNAANFNGHFDHFEYVGRCFDNRFSHVEPLIEVTSNA